MKIRLASKLTVKSIVDGPGLRTVVWTQGCIHKCKGCHNQLTWDKYGGLEYDTSDIVKEILNVEMQSGVTFSGGDPLEQYKACIEIMKELKKHNINIWLFTGYLYEKILKSERKEILNYIDVLVDGPFQIEKKSLSLKFKGSSNQRTINVKESLLNNKSKIKDDSSFSNLISNFNDIEKLSKKDIISGIEKNNLIIDLKTNHNTKT